MICTCCIVTSSVFINLLKNSLSQLRSFNNYYVLTDFSLGLDWKNIAMTVKDSFKSRILYRSEFHGPKYVHIVLSTSHIICVTFNVYDLYRNSFSTFSCFILSLTATTFINFVRGNLKLFDSSSEPIQQLLVLSLTSNCSDFNSVPCKIFYVCVADWFNQQIFNFKVI